MMTFSLKQEFDELVKATLTEHQAVTDTMEISNDNNINKKDMTDGLARNQDIFQDNKLSKKGERKYTTTRIKSRNFLSNMPYVGINKEDFSNENIIFDIYLLITKNLNPFSLDRK